jgi:hypothetical protein
VRHSSLTVAQSDELESIQKRVVRLMCQSIDNDYKLACVLVGIDDFYYRREQLTVKFFSRIVINTKSCLQYLVPDKCDLDISNKLRKSSQYQISQSRTVKFSKSFIPYCLSNCQWLTRFIRILYYCECDTPICCAIQQFCCQTNKIITYNI